MNTKELEEYFSVDPRKTASLKDQLAEKIGAFILSSPPGTLLPSERKLADALRISRVTVRSALKKYFDSGQLISCGRNGTKIAEQPVMFSHIDPGAFGIPVSGIELSFLCYENMPHQQNYWQSVVSLYNRRNPGRRVKINFADANSCPAAFEYPGGDIALVPHWITAAQCREHFQTLPRDFLHPKDDPEFLQELFSEGEEFSYFVPTELQFRLIVWNRKLADLCGFDPLAEEIFRSGFFGITRRGHEVLPEKFRIGGHVWDLLAFLCVSENDHFPAAAEDILRELASMPSDERIFFTNQRHSFDMIENFWQGKQLYTDIFSNFNGYLGKPAFPVETALFSLPAQGKKIVYPIKIGILKHSTQPEAAADFIRFLLSEEIQRRLFDSKRTFSLRKKYLEKLWTEGYFFSKADFEQHCSRLRLPAGFYAKSLQWAQFAAYDIRQEIIMVMRGKLSQDDALGKIRGKWFDKQNKIKKDIV